MSYGLCSLPVIIFFHFMDIMTNVMLFGIRAKESELLQKIAVLLSGIREAK